MVNPLPLESDFRLKLVSHMTEALLGRDPLSYLQESIFANNPDHVSRITMPFGRSLMDYFLDVVIYCERSAWFEEPPLIIGLLEAFRPLHEYQDLVQAIRDKGPYRCHPSTQPFWVCRVASDLPLFARYPTRIAAIQFSSGTSINKQPGQRVLRVNGPTGSGKTYTLTFFEYLASIQPLEVGVLNLDFGEGDLSTLAENQGILVELYIARRLEEQVRRRRQLLSAAKQAALPKPVGIGALPGVLPLPGVGPDTPFNFTQLNDLQQRTRWASQLANEFVNQVLARPKGIPPQWWVIVFDRCEKIPQLAEEFVRQLVQKAAGSNKDTAEEADRGPLRMVLLGDSSLVMPNPVYGAHLIDEDLSTQKFGLAEVAEYFQNFCLSRLMSLDPDPAVHVQCLQELAQQAIDRATTLLNTPGSKLLETQALAAAVNELTGPLETRAAEKRATAPPPQNGGGV